MTWIVEFYEEEDGHAPVEEFLSKLSKVHRSKAIAIVQRLKEAGPTLPFPYSSQVKGKLRELRTQYGKDRIRILYFSDRQRRFILLHAFIKRTEKLSERDIGTAARRMKQQELRMGTRSLKQPETSKKESWKRGETWPLELFLECLLSCEGARETECRWSGRDEPIEVIAEHGEGKILWNQERHMWFEGTTFCGKVQFRFPAPEAGRPITVQHPCKDAEMCFLKEFMNEIGFKEEGERSFVM